jgi:hypothetical protein
VYSLKQRWRDGTTPVVMTKAVLMEHLCARGCGRGHGRQRGTGRRYPLDEGVRGRQDDVTGSRL